MKQNVSSHKEPQGRGLNEASNVTYLARRMKQPKADKSKVLLSSLANDSSLSIHEMKVCCASVYVFVYL